MFGVRGLSQRIIKDVSMELFQLLHQKLCVKGNENVSARKMKGYSYMSSFPFMVKIKKRKCEY